MEVQNICNKCGELNNINSNDLKKVDTKADGVYYQLMCYKCKRCGEITVVQIDSMETINTCKDLKKLLIGVMKKKLHGQQVGKKEERKKERLNKLLDEKRAELNDLCSGKTFYDLDGKIFIKQLTLQKAGDIIESDL